MKIDLYRIAAAEACQEVVSADCGCPEKNVVAAEDKAPHGCEKLAGLKHPTTHCMENQGKHVKDPGAYCNYFVHEKCGIPRESVQKESFAGLTRENMV